MHVHVNQVVKIIVTTLADTINDFVDKSRKKEKKFYTGDLCSLERY